MVSKVKYDWLHHKLLPERGSWRVSRSILHINDEYLYSTRVNNEIFTAAIKITNRIHKEMFANNVWKTLPFQFRCFFVVAQDSNAQFNALLLLWNADAKGNHYSTITKKNMDKRHTYKRKQCENKRTQQIYKLSSLKKVMNMTNKKMRSKK